MDKVYSYNESDLYEVIKMTRGRIYLFDSKGDCYISDQYLFDMYLELPNGHGRSIISAFIRRRLRNGKELYRYTKDVYKKWFDIRVEEDDDLVRRIPHSEQVEISGTMDDYSYILNCSGKKIIMRVADTDLVIDKEELVVLNFKDVALRVRRIKGKYKIELVDGEINTCVNALDFYNRMYIGQYDQIDWNYRVRWSDYEKFNEFETARYRLYEAIRSIIMRETRIVDSNIFCSLGIWGDQTNDRAKSSYDMQQIMRYKKAYCVSPEGGNTVDFCTPMCEGSLPEIGCECRIENDRVIENICINADHAEIIDDALYISSCLAENNIRNIFEYYTNDSLALEIADVVNKMFAGIKRNPGEAEEINRLRDRFIFAGSEIVETA